MNSPKKFALDQMIKHWVTRTPSPRSGRTLLLRSAAAIKHAAPSEIPWFDAHLLHNSMNQYYSDFSWAMANGFQSRVVGCI